MRDDRDQHRLGGSLVGFGAAALLFSFSFGVVAAAEGISPAKALVTSATVFGGGAQFGALGVLESGGGIASAALVGLLLNSRFMVMGLPIAPRLDAGRLERMAMAVVAIDASLLTAAVEPDDQQMRRVYWTVGLVVFTLWVGGTGVGVVVGRGITDPGVLGLDVVLPAILLVFLEPLMRDRSARIAIVAAALAALLMLPVAPPGLPITLGAVVGAFALTVQRRIRRRAT